MVSEVKNYLVSQSSDLSEGDHHLRLKIRQQSSRALRLSKRSLTRGQLDLDGNRSLVLFSGVGRPQHLSRFRDGANAFTLLPSLHTGLVYTLTMEYFTFTLC